MNPLPPNVDELVSAYLDGQAEPDEVVTVESSPELLARVEELRAVAGALGAPVEAPPAQKELHLGAAMDLFDQLVAEGEYTGAASGADASAGEGGTGPVEAGDRPVAAPVVSLESARERRRPRRFNTGVIAAAAAALLLIVGLAALNLGRGSTSEDVATQAESVAVSADDSAADDSDDGDTSDELEDAASDTMSAAMDAGGDDASGGAADAERSAEPRAEPTVPFEPGEADESADDAMDDADGDADSADTAMDEEAPMDDAGNSALAVEEAEQDEAFAADAEPLQFDILIGEYADLDDLVTELESITDEELLARSAGLESGLFPGCQADVPELRNVESLTLVGEALIDGQRVEIHAFEPEGSSTRSAGGVLDLIVVDADDCSPITTID